MKFVLLDDQGTGQQFVFRNPQRIILANSREELPRAFGEIQTAQKNGKWLAGLMSYELGHALETRFDQQNRPLIQLGVFEKPTDEPPVDWLYTRDIPKLKFEPSWSEAAYLSRFETVQAYLRSGDCYQVNLTFPMFAKSDASPTQIYAAFRRRQPGRYGAVVSLGGADIVSFSPELFFERKSQNMRMRPMKGTRPRDADAEADAALLAEMQVEPKSRAENLMIVDLLRNDLSRLCKPGSVKVPELFALETYPTLHQMTSQVTGTLRENVSWTDIMTSLFPCGSVTGAPKIRAMEIIEELESGPRGAYCGSVGYIAPNGDASFSVAIRTVQMQDDKLRYDVGSGVVLDSDGPDEYRECLLKSRIFETSSEGAIETFRRRPNGVIPRAEFHQKRFASAVGEDMASEIFSALPEPLGSDELIRVVATESGLSSHISPFKKANAPIRLALSRYPLTKHLQETRVKTTARDFYDGERARIGAKTGADEVIFLNADGELCEGSFTSLFIEMDSKLLTPALSCGLLPGVLRQELIETGQAIEAKLTLSEIETADAVFVGNSLRGLMPATLIDFSPH
ncbi:MAG: aminodeoxychorismate synthase component I [Litorimonas sp.]